MWRRAHAGLLPSDRLVFRGGWAKVGEPEHLAEPKASFLRTSSRPPQPCEKVHRKSHVLARAAAEDVVPENLKDIAKSLDSPLSPLKYQRAKELVDGLFDRRSSLCAAASRGAGRLDMGKGGAKNKKQNYKLLSQPSLVRSTCCR